MPRLDQDGEATAPPPATTAALATTIARVAARLFAERGFDATSVREIAEASGVTKPTLYYHFGSKQGLGEAILTRPMASMAARLAALTSQGSGQTDPISVLESIFQIHLDFVVEDPDRSRFVYAVCFGPVGSSFHDEVDRYGEAFSRALLDVATWLADSGVIESDRIESCAQVCRGLIMSSTLEQIFLGRTLEAGLAGRLVSDLLGGFGRPEWSIALDPQRTEA